MVTHLEIDPKPLKFNRCDWTSESLTNLKQLIAENLQGGTYKRAAMERIEQRLDPTKKLDGEDEMAKDWAAHESESPTLEVYVKSLIEQWREIGCAADEAPYVLHGLVARLSGRHSPFRDQTDAAKSLAATFLDEAHCPGAMGSPRPIRRCSKCSPRRPRHKRQSRDAKSGVRHDQAAKVGA
jgi:hypothetical protein